ncbi:hypothetical protein KEM56_000139 [Ascosphaera pollenicola]|nr:hypothetical protein KEM56_000139 [Ascosphaera pollenicola]
MHVSPYDEESPKQPLDQIASDEIGNITPEQAQAQTHEAATAIHKRTEDADPAQRTILYLAYGSNLAAKNFIERRGVKPVSQVNVLVPELRLTFDQPCIPYLEPCFATTEFRDPDSDDDDATDRLKETDRLLSTAAHEKPWRKPLVGVAYEVTPADYGRIIRTEGGGLAYRDVVVDCYPFPDDYTPDQPVPMHPEKYAKPFRAHSLLAFSTALKVISYEDKRHTGHSEPLELLPGSEAPHQMRMKQLRPHKGGSQPSERYKKLLVTGAAEHSLPYEWQEYLKSIRAYRATTMRQKIAWIIVLACLFPIEVVMMSLIILLADEKGQSPRWLGPFRRFEQRSIWRMYDIILKPLFGDGETRDEE